MNGGITMKIKRHEVVSKFNGQTIGKYYYKTKEEAMSTVSKISDTYCKVYNGIKEIDLCCAVCEKELKLGDEYIKQDEKTRYCENCYEEHTVTYYTVRGEPVGDENDIEAFDSWDQE
jgi:hypothetical protein